MIMASAVCAY